MTSDLALILSYQGIRLLSRVEGGWHDLGEVAFDDPDMPAALSDLRARTEAALHPGVSAMLVVPNDQIKYLTFAPAEGARDADSLRAQAEDALKEATPYSLDELVFDVHLAADVAQVAAVARETLAEAEGFATEHGFLPVSFTAQSDAADFARAPDFGPTQMAAESGRRHEPDPILITVVGEGLPTPAQPEEPHADDADATDAEAASDPDLLTQAMAALSDDPPPDAQVAFAFKEPEEEAAEQVDAGRDDVADVRSEAGPSAEANTQSSESPGAHRAQRAQEAPQAATPLTGVSRKVHGTNAPSIPTERMSGDAPAVRFDPAKAVAGLTAARDTAQNEAGTSEEAAQGSGTFASARGKPNVAAPAPRTPPSVAKKPAKKRKDASAQKTPEFAVTQPAVGGKPKHLGLILTALLLVFMGLVALWATLFTEEGVAGLFSGGGDSEIAAGPSLEDQTPEAATEVSDTAVAQEVVEDSTSDAASTGSVALTVPDGLTLDAEADGTPTALLEELAPEELAESVDATAADTSVLSDGEAKARYAVSGVWQQAPKQTAAPMPVGDEDIYVPAIDRLSFALDAVALPAVDALITDATLPAQSNPPAADAAFDLDARGLVVATPEGALNAEGVMIYAGRPPVVPAAYPKRVIVADALREQSDAQLQRVRPKLRPENLLEQNERATLGGLTRAELANKRPRLRPESAQDSGQADQAPTRLAIKASLRPRAKPANIAQLAARAVPDETTPAVVATPASSIVVPSIPTTASVARQATVDNAINLKKTSLIGVYGTSSNRRALVRLPSGRYKKVQVGDRIDGGKVAAIGEDELRYVKSGRNLVLKMPKDG
jgi:hypothetical protein